MKNEVLLNLVIASQVFILIAGWVAYHSLVNWQKWSHKHVTNYMYTSFQNLKPNIPKPPVIKVENSMPSVVPKKKKKGSVWCPKKDIDFQMSGKDVDPFD
jgi:hypothetical protein